MGITTEIAALLLALLSIVASAAGVSIQLRKQWLLNSATMVTQLVDRYDSPQMRHDRRIMATMLTRHLSEGNGSIPDYAPVLGFFEHIGFLARKGVLDQEMLYNKFSFDLLRWHAAFSRHGNLIAQYRERQEEPTIYCEIDWLCAAFSKMDQKRGKRNGNAVGMESVISFLEQENQLMEQGGAFGSV